MNIKTWKIYIADVPFTIDFTQSKRRPVIVIGIVGDDLIILPITTQILKKQKQDFDIQLKKPSVIQVGNIQSINKKHIIKQYYTKSNQSNSINSEMQKQILQSLNNICSK